MRATLGRTIAARIAATLPPSERGKVLAVDVSSENYEIDENDFAATDKLLKRLPQAQIWLARVGYPTAYKMV